MLKLQNYCKYSELTLKAAADFSCKYLSEHRPVECNQLFDSDDIKDKKATKKRKKEKKTKRKKNRATTEKTNTGPTMFFS